MTTTQEQNQELRQRIWGALESQIAGEEQGSSVTVLSSLLAVQDELHYIPDEAIEQTAIFCKLTINDVWSVASFYTNFRFTPPGKTTLDVCWGPTCHLMGAQKVLEAVQQELGVDSEETSSDGNITLRYSTCLGACAHAPVIARDHVLSGHATPDSVRRYISIIQQEIEDGISH